MSRSAYYNIPVDILDTPETIAKCSDYCNSNDNHLIFFINAHCFNIAQQHPGYKNALEKANLVLNDGIGIKLGALIAGIHIKENMNGTDLIPKIIEWGAKNHKNLYLLGGEENIASIAKKNLEDRIHGLNIAGIRNGFFDFNNDREIIDDIISKKTDILIVGMGVPRQELWLVKNKDKLHGVQISVAGGAILDFLAQKVKRAPVWMQKAGIEWVFRLMQEPLRLFKRYFIGIPVFFFNIFKIKLS